MHQVGFHQVCVRLAAALGHRRRPRVIAGLAMATALVFAGQISPVMASGPLDSGTPGITVDPHGPRTPAQLGYTQAYADAKNVHFASALKTRMATFASTSGVATALVGPPTPIASSSGSLSTWTEYHQKNQSWCLPTTAQSILAWNFGASTYVGSSVAASQQTIANAIGNYTDDAAAFAYINGQFSRWGNGFHYVPINDKSSLASFETRIVEETSYWHQPLYVRVNVSSPYYAWTQTKVAYHATVSTGYYSSGAYTLIGDPYTDVAHTNYCTASPGHYPWWSSTSDYGCIYYQFPSNSYWKAMTGLVNGESPEYF